MTPDSSFVFDFDGRFARPLRLVGVTPATSAVRITGGSIEIRFGPWSLRTPLGNVSGATLTGPYRWFKVIGPHLSLADRGVTFGSNARLGVCVSFTEPVAALEPFGVLRHPGATVTVADSAGLVAALSAAGVAVDPSVSW